MQISKKKRKKGERGVKRTSSILKYRWSTFRNRCEVGHNDRERAFFEHAEVFERRNQRETSTGDVMFVARRFTSQIQFGLLFGRWTSHPTIMQASHHVTIFLSDIRGNNLCMDDDFQVTEASRQTFYHDWKDRISTSTSPKSSVEQGHTAQRRS